MWYLHANYAVRMWRAWCEDVTRMWQAWCEDVARMVCGDVVTMVLNMWWGCGEGGEMMWCEDVVRVRWGWCGWSEDLARNSVMMHMVRMVWGCGEDVVTMVLNIWWGCGEGRWWDDVMCDVRLVWMERGFGNGNDGGEDGVMMWSGWCEDMTSMVWGCGEDVALGIWGWWRRFKP